MDITFNEILEKLKKTTEENSFMKILNAVNEELSKDEDVIDVEKMIKVIEDNSPFDDETLIFGLLGSHAVSHHRRGVAMNRSFSTVDFI